METASKKMRNMQSLKTGTNKLIYKTEREVTDVKTKLWLWGGGKQQKDKLGDWD